METASTLLLWRMILVAAYGLTVYWLHKPNILPPYLFVGIVFSVFQRVDFWRRSISQQSIFGAFCIGWQYKPQCDQRFLILWPIRQLNQLCAQSIPPCARCKLSANFLLCICFVFTCGYYLLRIVLPVAAWTLFWWHCLKFASCKDLRLYQLTSNTRATVHIMLLKCEKYQVYGLKQVS